MSRIGKKPVALPKGVTASVEGQTVKVKGPKGELSVKLVQEVSASVGDDGITVAPRKDMEKAAQMWGLSRTLVNNLVTGVTAGFTHDVPYAIPPGITTVTEKPTMISVSGIDKQLVGQVAAEIRSWRPPEPYKGKGVRYEGEYVRRKEGKKK